MSFGAFLGLSQHPLLPYIYILSVLWITYSYLLIKGGFVSDDLAGIEQYDGTLLYPNDEGKTNEKKEVIKIRKVTYGTLSKWVRYHLCGGHFPSRHHYRKPDGSLGESIPSGKVPSHHHALSIVCQSIAVVLLYQFLLSITTPKVALLTTLLFIVHPTCLQAVAWPSAIGYILSLICICASLNISAWTYAHQDLGSIIIGLAGLSFFQVWGVYAQGIPMFTWVILLALGQWQMAIVAFLFSSLTSAINLRGYIVHRKEEFKKQHMEQSTSFNWRKPIVALKTIAYYAYLSVWPACLGLYHEWGFHYDKKMELIDWRAVCGFIIVVLSAILAFHGGIAVKVAVLWFYCFLFLFLNWITAQQWVTERYLYIPVIGASLLVTIALSSFPAVYWFIFGMLLCRTLTHIATYDNELRFYLSNTWNFPKSEVAFGNLGVAYATMGLSGASNDMWVISSTINKEYDVPHYNIYSRMKSQGFLLIQNGAYEQGLQSIAQSIPVLDKVLACKVLHFPEMWKKERDELIGILNNPVNLLVNELGRLYTIRKSLNDEMSKTTDQKRLSELAPSIHNNEKQITSLIGYLASKGVKADFNGERALLSKLTQRSLNGNANPRQ